MELASPMVRARLARTAPLHRAAWALAALAALVAAQAHAAAKLSKTPAVEDPRGFTIFAPEGAAIAPNDKGVTITVSPGVAIAVAWSAVFDERALLQSDSGDAHWQRVGAEKIWHTTMPIGAAALFVAGTYNEERGALTFVAQDTDATRELVIAMIRAVKWQKGPAALTIAMPGAKASVALDRGWVIGRQEARAVLLLTPARQLVGLGLEAGSAEPPAVTVGGFTGGEWQRTGRTWVQTGMQGAAPAALVALPAGRVTLTALGVGVDVDTLQRLVARTKLEVAPEDARVSALRQRLMGRRMSRKSTYSSSNSSSSNLQEISFCPDGTFRADATHMSAHFYGAYGGSSQSDADDADVGTWTVDVDDEGQPTIFFAGQAKSFSFTVSGRYRPQELLGESELHSPSSGKGGEANLLEDLGTISCR